MLFIQFYCSKSGMIGINTEFFIYSENYLGDTNGNPIEDIRENWSKGYDFGHIFIETPHKRYIFRKVIDAFSWVCFITEYIEKHKDDKNIFINLDELWSYSDGEFREFEAEFEVETI